MKTASLCVVALNEERFLPNLLRDLTAQTYPSELIEIVLIDGGSTDKTKEIMNAFREEARQFSNVKTLDNPLRTQAAGWNVAIENATGDVIFRIDAHSHIPSDFVQKNMARQDEGEFVTGGVRYCLIDDESSPWKATLLEAENSMFGSGVAKSRRENKERCYVKTMFHAAYRREVFEKVGKFNVRLLRTEDNEMHYRIRKAGYKLFYDPSVVSYQYARGNLRKMMKQKYGNGYWIGLTATVCPGCVSIYHFAPFAFVCGIVLTTILARFSYWQFAAAMWGAYLLFALLSARNAIANKKGNRWTASIPFLFLVLHVSYGFGTFVGLASAPFLRGGILRDSKRFTESKNNNA